MLNKKLFETKKDAEIARLKMSIEKFKEYDEARKKYYADKLQRLGELESWYDEIKDSKNDVTQLRLKVTEQQEEIKKLRKFIQIYKIRTNYNNEELNEEITIENLKRENKNLRERSKVMKNTLNNLILKLNKLEGHESLDRLS